MLARGAVLKEVLRVVAEEMLMLVAKDGSRQESHCNRGDSLEGVSAAINFRLEDK